MKGRIRNLMPSLLAIQLAKGAVSGLASGGIVLGAQALASLVSAQMSSQWLYQGYVDKGYASDGKLVKELNYRDQ